MSTFAGNGGGFFTKIEKRVLTFVLPASTATDMLIYTCPLATKAKIRLLIAQSPVVTPFNPPTISVKVKTNPHILTLDTFSFNSGSNDLSQILPQVNGFVDDTTQEISLVEGQELRFTGQTFIYPQTATITIIVSEETKL